MKITRILGNTYLYLNTSKKEKNKIKSSTVYHVTIHKKNTIAGGGRVYRT
jgi:hypothetical protein